MCSVLSAYDRYLLAVASRNFAEAEGQARTISGLPAETLMCCAAKLEVLKDLVRPEVWGPDRPERTILLGLADELRGLIK